MELQKYFMYPLVWLIITSIFMVVADLTIIDDHQATVSVFGLIAVVILTVIGANFYGEQKTNEILREYRQRDMEHEVARQVKEEMDKRAKYNM